LPGICQRLGSDELPTLERAYEVRLYGPPPVHQIGVFLDESASQRQCASQRRRGQGLPQKLDRLFRLGNSFLRPHLFWAKRELQEEEGQGEPCEEAHVSFITEHFRPYPALIPEKSDDAESSVSTYGFKSILQAISLSTGVVWHGCGRSDSRRILQSLRTLKIDG
jgi:hypothetical protein